MLSLLEISSNLIFATHAFKKMFNYAKLHLNSNINNDTQVII